MKQLRGWRSNQDDRSYSRGDVVWGENVFDEMNATRPSESDGKNRPWLVISNDAHPFDDQYLVMGMTSKAHKDSIPLSTQHWAEGYLDQQSYVSPWVVMSLTADQIHAKSGSLRTGFVDELLETFADFIN